MKLEDKTLLWTGGIIVALAVLWYIRRQHERTCTANINDPASTKCSDTGPLQGALDAVDDIFERFTFGEHASITTELQCESGVCLGDQQSATDNTSSGPIISTTQV